MKDPFDGLPPEMFTPEARARRELQADLGQFERVDIDPDPTAQAQLAQGVENLRAIPDDQWARLCREAVAQDPDRYAARNYNPQEETDG